MQQNMGVKGLVAGADLEAYRCVKLSGAAVVYAGEDELGIGVTQNKVASGEVVSVALRSTGRTFKATANEAMAAGASFYAGASGKIQDTDPGAGTIRGVALEASAADDELIEVLFV